MVDNQPVADSGPGNQNLGGCRLAQEPRVGDLELGAPLAPQQRDAVGDKLPLRLDEGSGRARGRSGQADGHLGTDTRTRGRDL